MTLWGGRFEGPASYSTWDFTTDDSDRRLLVVDIEGSIAHVAMLGSTGVIPRIDSEVMVEGLERILAEARAGSFEFTDTDEDVHTAVERRLGELVGSVAGKLHTGRSRNDQVALDLRLYLARTAEVRQDQAKQLALRLAEIAESHASTVVPSYTHLQQAQSTTLGHHLLAYAWMLLRDVERFEDVSKRIAVSPLGSGASAGSSLPLDRDSTAEALGLGGPMPNSLDAVGSRDFVAEYVFCCAQVMVDLSRLSEEIVLWASKEFGWVSLSDDVSTGSSALPQKRNPDIAELVRGRSAAVAGDMTAILALQKALPLAYNRDLQEDKRIVFHADDTTAAALAAIGDLLAGLEFHPPTPGSETAALDLAEALVARGVPFREAHEAVGGVVAHAEQAGKDLSEISGADLREVDSRFEDIDAGLLDPVASVAARRTAGSGNPDSVRLQIAAIREAVG